MKRHALALIAAVGLAACDVSPDQESAMGEENAREINSQVPIVTDPEINDYVTTLGDSIARHTSRSDLDWHFYVVNSHQVNAFSLPGGFVYVSRGLIESTDRLDELAGVLGHEIGHVIQRHSVKQMQSSQKLGVVATLACTLTNVCNSGLGQAAINIGGSAVIARHSRHDELQADSEAVENVLRVGIDPEGIPALFAVLVNERKYRPTIVDGWFASHPLEESRIQHAKGLIETLGADQQGGLLQDTPSYHSFRERIARLPEPPQPIDR
ncbi:MAG TPA: M48 family metallopeptidase [Gemmatimonadaceae bacterium]